jgi:hypothetical protein
MQNNRMLAALPLAALFSFAMHLPPAAAASEPGLVVVRDAQTGQVRAPTADELKALLKRGPTSSLQATEPQPAQVVTRPDGSRLLRLGKRGLVFSVVTRGADGKLAEQCVQGERAAAGALVQSAPTADKKEHRHEDR